jgi:hypothetical protein
VIVLTVLCSIYSIIKILLSPPCEGKSRDLLLGALLFFFVAEVGRESGNQVDQSARNDNGSFGLLPL